MIAMKIMIVEDEENIRDGIRNLGRLESGGV